MSLWRLLAVGQLKQFTPSESMITRLLHYTSCHINTSFQQRGASGADRLSCRPVRASHCNFISLYKTFGVIIYNIIYITPPAPSGCSSSACSGTVVQAHSNVQRRHWPSP